MGTKKLRETLPTLCNTVVKKEYQKQMYLSIFILRLNFLLMKVRFSLMKSAFNLLNYATFGIVLASLR